MNGEGVATWVPYDERVSALRDAEIRQRMTEEHLKDARDAVATARRNLEEMERVMALGLTEDATIRALGLLEVNGLPTNRSADVVRPMIRDAIEDLRNGAPRMQTEYFGIKAYDRWSAQREDHRYGYGPRHGSIWCSIGLRRDRIGETLTAEDRVAAITYLERLAEEALR